MPIGPNRHSLGRKCQQRDAGVQIPGFRTEREAADYYFRCFCFSLRRLIPCLFVMEFRIAIVLVLWSEVGVID